MKPLDSRALNKLQKQFQDACAYQQRGALDRAQHGYRRVLELDRWHVPSLNNLSLIYLQKQAWREAATLLQRSLDRQSEQPDTVCNLGVCHEKLGNVSAALSCYTQALQWRPAFAGAYYNRAALLRREGRVHDALADYRQALLIQPAYAEAHNNVGNVLTALGQIDEAIHSFNEALRWQPRYAEAWNNRGVCYWRQRRYTEALQDFDQALALSPNDTEALSNRLTAAFDAGDMAAASVTVNTLLALQPQHPTGLALQWEIAAKQCRWDDMAGYVMALEHAVQHGVPVRSFTLLAAVDDPAVQAQAARCWARSLRQHGWVVASGTHRAAMPVEGAPIRVAYLSGDFHEHAVALALVRVLELHSRQMFVWHALSCGPASDSPVRHRVQAAVDHFVDVRQWSDQAVCDYVAEQGIDIVVDLGGYTGSGRPSLVLSGVAPLQVNFLGYAGTLGDAAVDYVLTDRWSVPPAVADTFSEAVIWLANGFMPTDPTRAASPPPTRTAQGLPDGVFVFCCFNQPYKITPARFSVWMRVLARVPQSVLWLASEDGVVQTRLRYCADEHGIDPARLIFARRESQQADHLARLALADLFLDTAPYTAHATACDALWAGLPLLTCTGASFPARVSTSLLMHLGLSALVTETVAAYEARAVQLATQPTVLADLRNQLARCRHTSPVFDAMTMARQLEQAYRAMQARRVAGLPPISMTVSSS